MESSHSRLLFVDEAGDYYLLSRQTVEHARISREQKAALEALARTDTAGFAWPAGRPMTLTLLVRSTNGS